MEKERYTIESFEIDEPSCIFDNKTQQGILILVEYNYDEIVNLKNLLNQQDAKIKELEKENGYMLFEDGYDKDGNKIQKQIYTTYKQEFERLILENKKLRKENQQLKERNKQLKFDCAMYQSANYLINEYGIDRAREIMFQSEQKLKQSQNEKAIEVLEGIRKTIRYAIMICGGKATDEDVISANGYNRCLDDMKTIIDNQIKELRGEK